MRLEFTTTAVVRPDWLDLTYRTLNDSLTDVDLKTEGTLYINIDPVPRNSKEAIEEELDIAKSYFKTVHHRIGNPGGNFSEACAWTLNQPTGDYFFNIEDDWCFIEKFSIEEYIKEIQTSASNYDRIKSSDDVLQCVAGMTNVGGHAMFPPSLMQTKVIQSIIKDHPFRRNHNPERHLNELKFEKRLVHFDVIGCRAGTCAHTGHTWVRQYNIKKKQIHRPNKQGKMQGDFTVYSVPEDFPQD